MPPKPNPAAAATRVALGSVCASSASVARMSTPAPLPTSARLLEVGDIISVSAPDGAFHWVTITELRDDEPNRRILITLRDNATGRVGDINAAPGDKFNRQARDDDSREWVVVTATDYWRWIGTHVNHPNTGQRVMVIDVRSAQHPDDQRPIVAIVVANGPPIFSERTGHMLFEDN
jgi:hypothetical protein